MTEKRDIFLYNTLARRKEQFRPIDGQIAKIYSCGPTVYSTAHIGNLRAYVFTDVLKKTIAHAGYEVFSVMNTTDVGHLVSDGDDGDDKVEKAAKKQGITAKEIAAKYTKEFLDDCARLNIAPPNILAPATDYIDAMIEFIKGLEKKGLTYVTKDGVYFDSSKFPEYNKLSKMPLGKILAGLRIGMGEKKNAHDFALWKFVDKNAMQKWTSPWTPIGGTNPTEGCPGWHIECSVISRKHLGDTFDIHTGGVDHIAIHHTNEIAQSESLTGKEMAKFWLHNEFITVDGQKMSKSLGNVYSVSDLVAKGFDPLAYRYMCLGATYRTILNFTFDGLKSAEAALKNLVIMLYKHRESPLDQPTSAIAWQVGMFDNALFDDLNTPRALAALWDLIKLPLNRTVYDTVIGNFEKVLSLDLEKKVNEYAAVQDLNAQTENAPDEVVALANKRVEAKKARDFKLADELRAQIAKHGYEVLDTKDGFTLKKV